MKRVFAWTLFAGLLTACAFNAGKSMRPMDWSRAPLVDAGDAHRCPIPAGLFANEGQSSDPDTAPIPLAHLLFLDHLRGFPVEAIRLSILNDSETLLAQGILAGVPLESSREIIPEAEDCDSRWQVSTDSGAVDPQLRTEAVILTGGLLVPLSEIYRVSLEPSSDGALLVHLKWRAWVLGALLFPVRVNQQLWMRYPAYVAPVGAQ